MKKNRLFSLVVLLATVWCPVPTSHADDRVVTGTVTGKTTISSDEGIVFDAVTIAAGANVIADATFEVHLRPGTRIAAGARFSVQMRDNDGMPNRCELYYFGHLGEEPRDDWDKDLLLNFEECILNTDPTDFDMDNDDDGIEDWWEIKYFGLTLEYGRDDDYDGDQISNYVEYRLGLDPGNSQGLRPGIHYEYDDLGRVTQIQRIPGR